MFLTELVSSVQKALEALVPEAPPPLKRDRARLAPNGDIYHVPKRSSCFNATELLGSFVEELDNAFLGVANILGELKF